jgi:phosphomannomutase
MKIKEISSVKFGTSGVRGLVTDLTPRVAYLYTQAFLRHTPENKVGLGGDLRDSTENILRAVKQAIIDSDREAVYLGKIPTPALANWGLKRSLPVIMVTGSHIPADRNGIKFYKAEGEILKEDEEKIRETEIQEVEINLPELGPINLEAEKEYIERYQNFSLTENIVFYEHSAVGRNIIPTILEKLGAKVIKTGRSESFIGVDTEKTDTIKDKIDCIMKEYPGYTLVSTDGDSDRPLVVCPQKGIIKGDILGLLTAKMLQADCVITPISSSSALEKTGWFSEIRRTKIGSPYVIEEAKKGSGKIIGYEANGGTLVFSDTEKIKKLPTRDAVLPIIAFFYEKNTSLPAVFTDSGSVEKVKDISNPNFKNIKTIDLTDGTRMIFENNEIIHFRVSGNAPETRYYVEANTPERAQELKKIALSWLTQDL